MTGIEVTHDPEIPVHLVQLNLCEPCLDGVGGECHTPGCSLFLHTAPDLPVRNSAGVRIIEPGLGITLDPQVVAKYRLDK